MQKSKEVDSPDTDGSFTHKEQLRKGLNGAPHEIDSYDKTGRLPGINRFGENHPEPVLGKEGDKSISHFEHDPDYTWSHDNRSESFNEKSSAKPEAKDDEDETPAHDDEHILYQIRHGFSMHDDLDPSRVVIRVEGGLVFANGEVSSEDEILVIDRIVNEIVGVTGSMNTVSVRPMNHLHRGILGGIPDGATSVKGLH